MTAKRLTSRGFRRAFTLIELMIVVSIIALLAGLLLAALSSARDSGRHALCGSNLSQVGNAVTAFAVDHDRRLPTSGATSVGGDVTGLLWPYTRERWGQGIWRCPAHETFVENMWTSSYGYNWQYLLTPGPDYPHSGWNGFFNKGLRIAGLGRPSDTIAFVDHESPNLGNLWSFVARPGDNGNIDGIGHIDFRHADNAMGLMPDGHVETLPPAAGQAQNEPAFWDPRSPTP
jgi:prepilin-type N-terminal cleavage/methylation domain-containing protein/prepilin-type processing-associated H-X9-DG protein